MATTEKAQSSHPPKTEHQRPLRIVPLHTAPRIASTSSPQLTYRNGPLLTKVEVFAIYWGNPWNSSANAHLNRTWTIFSISFWPANCWTS